MSIKNKKVGKRAMFGDLGTLYPKQTHKGQVKYIINILCFKHTNF